MSRERWKWEESSRVKQIGECICSIRMFLIWLQTGGKSLKIVYFVQNYLKWFIYLFLWKEFQEGASDNY